jgi:hypothetical protein
LWIYAWLMNLQAVALAELDAVIAEYHSSAQDRAADRAVIVRLQSAIERLAPRDSPYVRQAREAEGWIAAKAGYQTSQAAKALRADYAAGYVRTVEELVHGEVFDDFLSMAEELQSKGYDPAAAVIAGSVLEEHLHKLASRHGLTPIPKSVDALGVELVKLGAITEPQRKIIAGWYGQRTEAAHGRHANVVHEEVGRMIEGVRDFLVRYPA